MSEPEFRSPRAIPTRMELPGEDLDPTQRQNPTDHARTAHPRAGEWFKNSRDGLGLGLLAVGVVAMAACLFAAAHGRTAWATWLGLGAAIAGLGGGLWLFVEGRRLRRVEARRETTQDESPP